MLTLTDGDLQAIFDLVLLATVFFAAVVGFALGAIFSKRGGS